MNLPLGGTRQGRDGEPSAGRGLFTTLTELLAGRDSVDPPRHLLDLSESIASCGVLSNHMEAGIQSFTNRFECGMLSQFRGYFEPMFGFEKGIRSSGDELTLFFPFLACTSCCLRGLGPTTFLLSGMGRGRAR